MDATNETPADEMTTNGATANGTTADGATGADDEAPFEGGANSEQIAQALRQVSAALMYLRLKSPFFAALALFARIIVVESLPTAATDGRDIYVNPDFLDSLSLKERAGLLLHEVLHAALLHVTRRGSRDPWLWNIAADIVVNGVIAREKAYELPDGAVRDEVIEHLSVEEVYHRLLTDPSRRPLVFDLRDLLDAFDAPGQEGPGAAAGILGERRRAGIEEHWHAALEQARAVVEAAGRGTTPSGLIRELGAIRQAHLDWRAQLWRFLVRTPTDFVGFDRRFIGRGLYLETLDGESLRVYVAVDTSGSVATRQMETFLGEVQGILGAYPQVACQLYYADATCYGPYPLTASDPLPKPRGGGGTDFRPFFSAVAREDDSHGEAVCVYLTDGEGTFPREAPSIPVLWVITAGGIALEAVPFGEAVRLIEER